MTPVSLQKSLKPRDKLSAMFYKTGKNNQPRDVSQVSRKKVLSDKIEEQWHSFARIGQQDKVHDYLKQQAQSQGASRVLEQGRNNLIERKKHRFGKKTDSSLNLWLCCLLALGLGQGINLSELQALYLIIKTKSYNN